MLAPPLLDALIDRILAEDLAGGDLTSEACIEASARATGTAVARQALVVCGGAVFRRVFERLDPDARFEGLAAEGAALPLGAPLWRVAGNARALLSGERTALNLTQRMSGVATAARRYVEALPAGSTTRITDTRKTTPGLRPLERYAVRTGGAHNHRDNLGSAVLIKDNHLVAAGGIAVAVARARARAPHTSRIEVEVASLAELEQAIKAGADIIMLDNFTLADVHEAVRRVRALPGAPPLLEVSGRITLPRIGELAAAGVDLISCGALTHSAPAADIALDSGAVSDLSAAAVARELDRLGAPVGRPLVVVPVTASTNDDARAAAAGAAHGASFVADAQTAGRGRGGHAWHSPPGENVYLSVVLRPRVPAGGIAPITLAVGVAVALALEAALGGRSPVWVKWPNDVLAGPAGARRKLAGVLVEGQLRGGEVVSLVAGVGVNVHAASFPDEIAARATSLALLGAAGLDRSALAARLIAAVGAAVARFEQGRLTSFAADLHRLDALRGALVEVAGVRGVAEGIDSEGRLLVRGESGALTAVVSGEVLPVAPPPSDGPSSPPP